MKTEADDEEQARREPHGQGESPQATAASAMDIARGLPIVPIVSAGEPQEADYQANRA